MTGGWESQMGQLFPAGLPGAFPTQGADWPQRDGFAHGQPAVWKQSFVFFCFMTSASGKSLAPQMGPENMDDDAQGRKQYAVLGGSDLSWIHCLSLGVG